MNKPDALLLLPRLRVQNINAISGPLTWGFPSPTAFTGFIHALHRRMAHPELTLDGVGIISHRFEPQVFRPPGKRTQVFRLTRNPVDKNGDSAPFVEEGRAHLELSLLIGVHGYLDEREGEYFAEEILSTVQGMRLAGGSILPPSDEKHFKPQWFPLPDDQQGRDAVFRRLRRRLLPGFALVGREDLLRTHLAELKERQPDATVLDALLDLSRLNIEPVANDPEQPEKVTWQVRRKPGWLVPIPVGYGAISALYEPGEVVNARDESTSFRFVESLYSLGEWVSPHRLESLQQLLWHHHSQPDAGLYRCINTFTSTDAI